jgi:hypothetical protein
MTTIETTVEQLAQKLAAPYGMEYLTLTEEQEIADQAVTMALEINRDGMSHELVRIIREADDEEEALLLVDELRRDLELLAREAIDEGRFEGRRLVLVSCAGRRIRLVTLEPVGYRPWNPR